MESSRFRLRGLLLLVNQFSNLVLFSENRGLGLEILGGVLKILGGVLDLEIRLPFQDSEIREGYGVLKIREVCELFVSEQVEERSDVGQQE